MKTYQETLEHIQRNKHLYIDEVSWTQAGKLNAKLEVVSYVYDVSFMDVTNDYADLAPVK